MLGGRGRMIRLLSERRDHFPELLEASLIIRQRTRRMNENDEYPGGFS